MKKKQINEMPHVSYDKVQVPQFKNKMVDFRWQRFLNDDKQLYKTLFNSFKSGKGIAAKIKNDDKFLIFTPDKVIKSSSDKGLPHVTDDWYKYIKIIDGMDF